MPTATYLRKRYRKHKAQGLCVDCSEKALKDRVTCRKHLEDQTKKSAKTRQQRKEKGQCLLCYRKVVKNRKKCKLHLHQDNALQSLLSATAKKRGLCVSCKKVSVKNTPFNECEGCRNRRALNARRRYNLKGKRLRSKKFFWRRAVVFHRERERFAKILYSLWKVQKGKCALTGARLSRENSEIDHIVPKSRGGTNDKTNLRWLSSEVNQAKRNLLDADFIRLCKRVVAYSEGHFV